MFTIGYKFKIYILTDVVAATQTVSLQPEG